MYYIFGDLRNNYVIPNSQSTSRGIYTMTYDGASKVLNYQIITNLQGVGAVELRGPAACKPSTGGILDPTSSQCIVNTGPVIETFGRGRTPTTTNQDTTFQNFKGSITLSAVEEAMLFNEELYIMVNSATLDDKNNVVEQPSLRGNIGVYTIFYSLTNYPTYYYDNKNIFLVLSFAANDGSFPQEKSSSQSLGNGFMWFNLNSNGQISNNQLNLRIYSTIETPGNYLLKCGGTSLILNNNQNNPNPLETTLTLTNTALFLELLASKECYVFITSSTFPDGDLFSWIWVPSNLDSYLKGTGETTPVQSPYYGRVIYHFDYGSKMLSYVAYHNITSPINGAFVEFDNGTMICNATGRLNGPQFCYVNDTIVPFFEQGKVYFNIYTAANPSGELRGKVEFNGKSSASLGSNSGMASSTAIGLGVGLGIGIPLVILVGVGIFCLVKRGGGSKGI
jgi:hypothetical protein